MKRGIVRLTLLVVLIFLAFLSSGTATAGSDFPVFHSIETFCSAGAAERAWSADNTHHGRNALYTSIVDSDNPEVLYDGIAYANWNINIKTMQGVGWGTYKHTVLGSSDGWRGNWTAESHIAWPLVLMAPQGDPLWLNDGQGVGHGFGAFEGMQVKFEFHAFVNVFAEEPTGFPCVTGQTIDGNYFVLQQEVTGYIIGQ
jgi:hypothetical protein